jgi:hypothetical protein
MMATCDAPIPFETLVALWADDLSADEAETVEAHLFACDACAEASEGLGRLVGGLREVIPLVLSHAQREQLRARGMRLLHTPVDAGVTAHARFAPELDLLVHGLRGDFSRADRLDIDLVTADGETQLSLEAVPFDADAGEVLIACQRHYEGIFPDGTDPRFRVYAVFGDDRELVGEYYVEHDWAST